MSKNIKEWVGDGINTSREQGGINTEEHSTFTNRSLAGNEDSPCNLDIITLSSHHRTPHQASSVLNAESPQCQLIQHLLFLVKMAIKGQ